MALAWTLAKFLLKVVAPTVPEVVSTVATIRKQRLQAQAQASEQEHAIEQRLTELERTVATHLQLAEQLTAQLQATHQTLTLALRIAIAGLLLSLVALGVLFLR